MELPDLDFPVLMLAAHPGPPPFLSGCGGGELISGVEVAYEPDDEEAPATEPSLRLSTRVRRGWRMVHGHPIAVAADLVTLGTEAATDVLLSDIPSGRGGSFTRQAADLAMERGNGLGARIPCAPWTLHTVVVDDIDYALWLLPFDNDRFCVVADCGPIVLTGTGRHGTAWTWTLRAVPASEARLQLRPAPGE